VETNARERLAGFRAGPQRPVIGGYLRVRIENRPFETTERAAASNAGEVRTKGPALIRDGVALGAASSFVNTLTASGVAFGSPRGFTDAQGSNKGGDLPYLAPRAAIRRHRSTCDSFGDDLKERFVGIAAAESAHGEVGTTCA